MPRLNKEIISFVAFSAAFVIFILSSYGIGKAESEEDKPLKDFATVGLVSSTLAMVAVWFVTWQLQTPKYSSDFLKSWAGKMKEIK